MTERWRETYDQWKLAGPEYDDDDQPELGVDVCQHGKGFDETCGRCEDEIAADRAAPQASGDQA